VLASAGDRHAIRDRARIGNRRAGLEGVTGSIAFDCHHGDVPAKSVVIGTCGAAGWSRRLRLDTIRWRIIAGLAGLLAG